MIYPTCVARKESCCENFSREYSTRGGARDERVRVCVCVVRVYFSGVFVREPASPRIRARLIADNTCVRRKRDYLG